MSIITHSENASQSHHAEQVSAKEDSAQAKDAKLPKRLAASTIGQSRCSKQASGVVAGRNETSAQPIAAGATASAPAASARPKKVSKQNTVLELLSQFEGATIDELMDATTWQAHSVRGFLSGTVRKKLKMHLISDVVGNGVRRYRVAPSGKAGPSGEAGDQPAAGGSSNTQGV